MPDPIATISTGKRYVQTYRNGMVKISAVQKTENPQPAKVVDVKPTLTKEQTLVKLPPEKWEVLADGTVKVAYELKTVKPVKEPVLEKT